MVKLTNLQRWLLTFAMGAMGGVLQCAMDTQPQHFADYVRHAIIGLGPATAALNLTLKAGSNG